MTDRPHVTAVMVSSLDGAVHADGGSQGLSTDADRVLFRSLRRAAEVVLVGAGTVRAENYRGIRPRRPSADDPQPGPPPPVAVVTGSAGLDPASRLFTDTVAAPLVLTTAAAPAARRDAIAAAGGEVVVLGDLSPATVLGALAARGYRQVLCEGGPTLLGDLVAADAVDELRLTLVPLLVGGPAARIAAGPDAVVPPHRMRLAGHEAAVDGTLLLRYLRDRPAGSVTTAVTPPNE
ncbi:dihydrofolate reductase family protein [Pseudonocardia phyllosphaerae]|uniref:dihydrofolate reductase family protein n=1 Tax=Pseudonocardia phyllosphaerae TaxID=3390502 RepID=UPI00397A95EF